MVNDCLLDFFSFFVVHYLRNTFFFSFFFCCSIFMASLPFIPSVTVNYPSSVMTLLILSLEQVRNKLQAKKMNH